MAVLYYRAQQLAGNTSYVEALCDAIEDAGGRALPLYCASLRTAEPALMAELARADAMVVTVLAAGGARPATVSAGGDDDGWNVEHLAALDVPILQGLCLTTGRAQWSGNDDGLSPLDVATQVAVPEFDGRIVTVPFSFKEIDDEGLIAYVADPERCARVAGLAVRQARLRHVAPPDKKVALVFSAYPTKHARIGNAVGLDTPASAVALLRAMREAGYVIGDIPGVDAGDGDALVHALIERGGQDPRLADRGPVGGQPDPGAGPGLPRRGSPRCPPSSRTLSSSTGVRRPASCSSTAVAIRTVKSSSPQCNPATSLLLVQPPRGFGERPVAIYHDPDLPPSHHYLAAYRWLDDEFPGSFGAHAVVHIGKHGNLEWLPGKTLGMSASCGADAALGDLPLIYPFLVNDPGEGTQAKRRAHAVLVDHLIPPMARAESYGDIARLEQLLDEHANIAALDPGKAARHPSADLDADAGGQDGPRSRAGRSARRGLVRRHAAARRRLAVRDQGRPDPRRPAHPRRNADRGSRTRSGARDPAGPPAVRRRGFGARPASGTRAGRGR